MSTFKNILLRSIICILVFTLLCGVIYTAVMTCISQLLFPHTANGSIIEINGKKYGSTLLGQQFTDDNHMWGRIMNIDTQTFTDDNGNHLLYSWASNLSPASEEFANLIEERTAKIREAHPEKGDTAIPVDLVTCSGSGLDPDISVAAAEYQMERIAKNNNMDISEVRNIIAKCTNHKLLGLFGEETVNVLKVNLMIECILK